MQIKELMKELMKVQMKVQMKVPKKVQMKVQMKVVKSRSAYEGEGRASRGGSDTDVEIGKARRDKKTRRITPERRKVKGRWAA